MPFSHPNREPAPTRAETDEPTPPLVQATSPVNAALIGSCVLLFFYTAWGQNIRRMLPFLISLSPASSPDRLSEVFHGEIWRLFTPMFLHYGIQHLGFNMLGMVNLGGPLEKVSGSRTYLLLCLALALLSNLGEYFIGGAPNFGGMSGVLYGLFGYIWMRGRCDPGFVLQMPSQTIVIALIWFVACFTGALGPIANAAHGIGLVAGAIWGVAAGRASLRRLQAGRGTAFTEPLRPPSGR